MNINASRLLAPFAVALGLLLLTGCPDSETLEQCETSEDCRDDEVCNDGVCEPLDCDPACEDGFECIEGACFCASHDACEPWEMCEDGHCVADPDAECSPVRDCAEGYTCDGATCVCARDRLCDAGEVCDDGECRPATACESDAQCAGEDRHCVDGQCIEPCINSQECGSPAYAFACVEGYCYSRCFLSDEDCEVGEICETLDELTVCVEAECATLADCGSPDEVCTSADHGRCVAVEYCEDDEGCHWSEACRTPSPCPPGFDCESDMLCLPRTPCADDDDCVTDGGQGYCHRGYCYDTSGCQVRADCDEGFDCVGGTCVPMVCRGPADCAEGEVCSGGVCVTGDPDEPADRVEILTPGSHILGGEEKRLIAVAYDNTDRVIVGAEIAWSSSHPDSVAVDPVTGVITGGTAPGTAIITAGYQEESATATWHLLADIEEGELRVTVVDGESGRPVEGALVKVSAELEGLSGDDGVTLFPLEGEEMLDVHVFHEDHDYVSIFAAAGRDLLVPLPRRSDPERAAGVTGGISYDFVSTEGDLAVGLAGTSLGGPLVDFDLERLVGDIFISDVPMIGEIPLPGAMTAEATFMGMSFNIKDTYYALGEEGLRMGWSFAGRLSLDGMMGGGGDMNIASLLPLFGLFEHGLQARVPLAERPLVQDLGDINGNGDTDEMVPDWTWFPQRNHAPAQAQDLRLLVSGGELPSLGGQPLTSTILIGGARSPRVGLVPLGLSATEAEEGGMPTVRMRMAPVYGGLEVGSYQVIAMAVPDTSGFDIPREVSVRVVTTQEMPEVVELGSFLAFPESTTWNSASRTIDHASVADAHLFRSVIQGDERAWHVYAPDPDEGSILLPLPEVPEGLDGAGGLERAVVSPIRLAPAFTYEGLLHVSGKGLLDLDQVTAAYSRSIR